jgi:predicted phosphoribosyltransferase
VYFKDRIDAGQKLSLLLSDYKGKDVVVYALPRGGAVVAAEIAKYLNAPLELVFAHKIGHPFQPEYAIAAVSESGHLIKSSHALLEADEHWIEEQKQNQMQKMKARRELYLKGRKESPVKGKIALIVDDGIATGLTMQAGIMEIKDRHPQKIIAVVTVAPRTTADLIKSMVDDVVAVEIPDDYSFLGSVGAYYAEFSQVEDNEVIQLLEEHPWKS